MQQTEHYNLNLPEGADRVDIEALNANSDVLDTVIYQVQAKAEAPVYYSQVLNTPSALPASDVYPWAKGSMKPQYTANEVGTMTTTQITQITDDLDNRVTQLEEGAVDVETITNEQIDSLFENPIPPEPSI